MSFKFTVPYYSLIDWLSALGVGKKAVAGPVSTSTDSDGSSAGLRGKRTRSRFAENQAPTTGGMSDRVGVDSGNLGNNVTTARNSYTHAAQTPSAMKSIMEQGLSSS